MASEREDRENSKPAGHTLNVLNGRRLAQHSGYPVYTDIYISEKDEAHLNKLVANTKMLSKFPETAQYFLTPG